MFQQPIKSREQCFAEIIEYFSPTITFIRDENMLEEFQAPVDSSWKTSRNEAWSRLPDEDDHMNYFGLTITGRNTIRYCSATGVHGLIHEAAHFLLAKGAWDISQHGPDLYKFCDGMKDNGHPYAQMEEMCVEFIGYQILDKLNMTFDALMNDMVDRSSSGQVKPLDLTPVGDYLSDDVVPEIYIKGDIDFSPIYMFKVANCSGDVLENVRTNPLFKLYGHEFFHLCGCVDEEMNILGTLDRDVVRSNKKEIAAIFNLAHPYDDEFIDFICL